VRCDCVSCARHTNCAVRLCQLCTAHQLCSAIVSVSQGIPIVRCDCFSLAGHTNCAVRLFQSCTMLKQSRPATPIPPTVKSMAQAMRVKSMAQAMTVFFCPSHELRTACVLLYSNEQEYSKCNQHFSNRRPSPRFKHR
jgi:hypothetical protein